MASLFETGTIQNGIDYSPALWQRDCTWIHIIVSGENGWLAAVTSQDIHNFLLNNFNAEYW